MKNTTSRKLGITEGRKERAKKGTAKLAMQDAAIYLSTFLELIDNGNNGYGWGATATKSLVKKKKEIQKLVKDLEISARTL